MARDQMWTGRDRHRVNGTEPGGVGHSVDQIAQRTGGDDRIVPEVDGQQRDSQHDWGHDQKIREAYQGTNN